MSRFYRVPAGEWQEPVSEGYKMACCDCCLVHKMDFRIHEGRIQMRAVRDERSTAQMRRHRRVLNK